MNYTEILLDAIDAGHLDTVQVAVEHGANIHVWEGWPIKLAALKGDRPIVRYLKTEATRRTHNAKTT